MSIVPTQDMPGVTREWIEQVTTEMHFDQNGTRRGLIVHAAEGPAACCAQYRVRLGRPVPVEPGPPGATRCHDHVNPSPVISRK